MVRYDDVGDEVLDLLNEVKNEYFPELRSARIRVFFDNKKKMSKGNMVLASISKTNDLQKYLTIEESGSENGYDYFLYLDATIWNGGATKDDKVRIIRHELRHTAVDLEKDNPYGLRDHEISDFYDEIALNSEDAKWAERLVAVGESLYEKQKEDKKGKK